MKKLLLFIALIISGLGLNAQTQYDVDGYGKFTITSINPPECRLEKSDITRYCESYIIPEAVVINSKVYYVTSIGNSVFLGNTKLQSIVIPSGIKEILGAAFRECQYLQSVIFEENSQLATIGGNAFRLTSIKDIEIPNSVTYIGDGAFGQTEYSSIALLETITFGENSQLTYIGDNAFEYQRKLQIVNFEAIPQLITIGYAAFQGCSNLIGISFLNNSPLTTIGGCAFKGCSSLLSVDFGDNSKLTTVGYAAFEGCSSLLSFDFGDNSPLTTIEEETFKTCKNLTSLKIPAGVTVIKSNAFTYCGIDSLSFEKKSQLTIIEGSAFYLCYGLLNLDFSDTQLTTIGSNAFKESSLLSIDFGDNSKLTTIGDYAFYDCERLTSVNFGENSQITTIGNYTFDKCSSLLSVDFGNNSQLETIGPWAFSECWNLLSVNFGDNSRLKTISGFSSVGRLTDLKIPEGVTSISGFDKCSGLVSLEIPSSVTEIDGFYNASGLEIVKCYAKEVPSAGNSFVGNNTDLSLVKLLVPKDSYLLYKYSYPWSNFNVCTGIDYNIKVYSSNDNYGTVVGGGNFMEDDYVTITATANTNYKFVNWTENNVVVSTNPEYSFVASANRNLVANFELETYNVSVQITPDNAGTVEGAGVHSYGSEITLKATANAGYVFVCYMENEEVVSDKATYSFVVNSNRNIVAKFVKILVPTNLVATAESTSTIKLTWDKMDGATSYKIYWSKGNPAIATVTENSYLVQDLEPYGYYGFKVAAVYNKKESNKSDFVWIYTLDLPVSVPENVVTEATGTSSISLTWDIVENALSYNIYRGTTKVVKNVTDNNYVFNNLNSYADYCYTVTAVRNKTESEKSEPSCAKTFDLPITTPTNLVAEATSTSSISLTWNAVENALSYNIYNGVNKVANVTTTSYVVDNLNYYTDYCFTVSAVRNETETENSEPSCAKTFDLPITTPTNLVAEATSTSSISLTWNAVENALSYNIYNGVNKVANVATTSYVVDNLNYYTDYCFTVSAVRNETETENSEPSCAKTFDLPITTPANLVAEATSTSSISLAWDKVENALSYNIYNGVNKVANVTTTSYVVNNLNYYTDYCFTVTAVRNETETEKSEPSCAKTFDLSITTPTNLVAEAISTSSISLTWNAVENALSYNIYNGVNKVANVTTNSYEVNNLNYYTDYCFTVTAVRNETETAKSELACEKTFDLPIVTPENVIAEATSTSSISLTWNAVENALSYNIYNGVNKVANVTTNSYEVDNLNYYTDYCFTVSAVRNETETENSEPSCAKTFDLPITTPNNLVAEATGTSSISLTWNAVENALSYNIYNGVNKVANVTTTSYVVDNLNYYTDYCFTVSAVRNETETDKSEEDCSKTFDLSITTPENLIAEALNFSSISLTWEAVENALSYNVYNGGIMIANVTGNSYIVNDLNYDTDYCYTVTAVRNETETDKSEEACAKTLLPITTPENVIAEATGVSSISLTWNAVENALSYNVYSGENKIANVIENTYIVNELNYYTDYCFTVTAVRNETETAKSELACAKTFDLSITMPVNLTATPINTSSIILTWNVVENALSYNVYQDNSLIANVASNMYSANDLESYTEYCFTVTSVRNETESDKSEEVCAKTFDLPMVTPEGLVATPVSTSSIILTWEMVENALSYNIYRDNELVKNLKNTNYTDTGLEYDTEYCYVVTAVRNETESDKSEQVCVKTLGEGVNETSLYVNVYPTPATDKLYIDTEAYIEEICIYTLSGVMIYREIDFDNKSIDVSNMNSGVYFVMIKTNDVVVTKRFVKE